MTDRRASSRRAAQHERDTARSLGSIRTARRGSYRREPDVAPIAVGDVVLQPECKVRRRVPRVIVDGMQQARGYSPGAVPLVVLRAHVGESIACLPLDALVALLGLDKAELPRRHRPTRRAPQQSSWGWA